MCQWFVLFPPQTNPIWPWEKATAGDSRRTLSQGAPRGHGGISPKLWQGYPSICWANKCRPVIGHPVHWCNPAVGRWRKTVSSVPTAASQKGVTYLVNLSHALRTADFMHYIFAYNVLVAFKQQSLLRFTQDWGQKVRESVSLWNQNSHSEQSPCYCQYTTRKKGIALNCSGHFQPTCWFTCQSMFELCEEERRI